MAAGTYIADRDSVAADKALFPAASFWYRKEADSKVMDLYYAQLQKHRTLIHRGSTRGLGPREYEPGVCSVPESPMSSVGQPHCNQHQDTESGGTDEGQDHNEQCCIHVCYTANRTLTARVSRPLVVAPRRFRCPSTQPPFTKTKQFTAYKLRETQKSKDFHN
jgi:hypothetical protein